MSRAGRSRAALLGAVAACTAAWLVAAPARADGADGVYGRFEGDLELRVHAGAAFAAGGPALAAGVAAVYLSTAGVYLHVTDALGGSSPRVLHSVASGVHLAPLFLIRGASNAERGPATFDLFLDSIALELGAVWAEPRGAPWSSTPGLEVALDLGLPLLGRATGPFLGLRGALRWRPADFAPLAPTDAIDRGAVLSLTLGWHHVVNTHLIEVGDRVMP